MSLLSSFRHALSIRDRKSARRRLTIVPESSADFSSNDFLSLSRSPVFRRKLLSILNNAPASQPFASGGSRLLDGNSGYAEALEAYIAGFHGAASGLLFNSGFDANVGVLSSIPQPGDVVVYDELIHASMHEGMRLSRAGARVMFPHSSVGGLRDVLLRVREEDPRVAAGARNVFVVVESLYSMEGDVAPVGEFVRVVEECLPAGNGYFVIDEAHATGVFGPNGAGVVQDRGLEEKMFIRVHTFGKALACHGAIVLCCPETREYLVNYARSLIYTTALGFPFLAAIRAVYELLSEGETENARRSLHQRTLHLQSRLADLGSLNPALLAVDHFPNSPIFSLRTSAPRQLAEVCQQRGFVVRKIMPPTVPAGKERVRVCLHAGNTADEIDGLAGTIRSWVNGGEKARL